MSFTPPLESQQGVQQKECAYRKNKKRKKGKKIGYPLPPSLPPFPSSQYAHIPATHPTNQ